MANIQRFAEFDHILPYGMGGFAVPGYSTERYLGKISGVEAMKWIDNLYA